MQINNNAGSFDLAKETVIKIIFQFPLIKKVRIRLLKKHKDCSCSDNKQVDIYYSGRIIRKVKINQING